MYNYYFKTKELTFGQKLLQLYWFNPKSWLLDEMTIEGDNLTIIRKDGHVFHGKCSEIQASYTIDRYYRKEFKIKDAAGNKTRFKEIPDMLSLEQWITILVTLNAQESKLSKLFSFLFPFLKK